VKNKSQLIILDFLLTFVSIIIGLILRLEIIYVGYFVRSILPFIILAMLVRPSFFYIFGIYNRIWEHASTREFIRFAISILVGSVFLIAVTWLWLYPRWMTTFPRSLFAIEAMTSLFILGGIRVGMRILQSSKSNQKKDQLSPAQIERTLIVGAQYE